MKIKSLITRIIYTLIPKKGKLIILDNYFPNLNCGFKIHEYHYLLDAFPNSEIHSAWPEFENAMKVYSKKYPEYAKRVKKFCSKRLHFASLFYCNFLHTTHAFLPLIERENTPFVFTLYGGGFFGLHYPKSDKMLSDICASPLLQKIIVSQTITRDYLLSKKFCRKDAIELVYGSTPSENQSQSKEKPTQKQYYKKDKDTFDIAFVGRRHTPQGRDKGYHIFVEVAQMLAKQKHIQFHVAGDFSENTIPLGAAKGNISFYGEIPIDSLPHFFADKDVYLSPNVSNIILPGSFEGITGTCQEAAYAGCAVFCSDPLNLNLYFTHQKDIVFIPNDAKMISKQIEYYMRNSEKLYTLSEKGKQSFLDVFDYKKHMSLKERILRSCLS